MRILLLGGTSFVGRAIVEEALRQGIEPDLFGRGKTGADLFPGLRRLIGDRDSDDYAALRFHEWDAVVDVSGYLPRQVGRAMDALDDRAGRYLFISSQAVYVKSGEGRGFDEETPRRAPVRDTEELSEASYGPLKAACEDDVRERFGDRAAIVRPGRVVGPHDTADAFTYWVRRARQGGRVAVPADPDQPVQLIDSRDLAALVVKLLRDKRSGVFNAVGPRRPTTLGELIHTCAAVAGTEVELVRVPSTGPFFPLVRAESEWATQRRGAERAYAAGMPATPLPVTAADVAAWDRQRGEPPLTAGYSAAEEAALLRATG